MTDKQIKSWVEASEHFIRALNEAGNVVSWVHDYINQEKEEDRMQVQIEDCDQRHGGPFERGMLDSFHRRGRMAHYYEGASYSTRRIERAEMTPRQIAEYMLGFAMNEETGEYAEH